MYSLAHDNILRLYISSPFAAIGTVTIPNSSNGPVLVVTDAGDTNVNGTYVLTNATVNPGEYSEGGNPLEGGTLTNAYVKGSLLIFFDEDYADTYGWVLADSVTKYVLYYGFYEVYNFNEVVWQYGNDGDGSVPTTSCSIFPYVQSFSVTASNVTNVQLPIYTMISDSDAVGTNHGINVASSEPVSVYAVDYESAASAAFTCYPTSLLGTNYRVMARAAPVANGGGGNSELTIVASADTTTVTITPSPTANLYHHSGTNSYTTNLDMGQTYQINSANSTGDVTGTLVASDRSIAVFAGVNLANVPDLATQAANPLVQEQIPVSDWGTQALALSFAGRSNGASYRILVASNDTVITIRGKVVTVTNETSPGPWLVTTSNGVVVVTTNAGQFYDIILDGPVVFQASKPIQVAQFANGTYFDALEGDPCEILLPPTGHYLVTNIVVSLGNNAGDFDENYLNIIVPQSATNSTFVDGTLVPASSFEAITNSGFYGAQISVTNASLTHIVTSSQPVGVEVYGWGNDDAYGFLGGVVK